jgi:hypothetical protein
MALRFQTEKKGLRKTKQYHSRQETGEGQIINGIYIIVWNQFKYLIKYSIQACDNLIIKSMLDSYKQAYRCSLIIQLS